MPGGSWGSGNGGGTVRSPAALQPVCVAARAALEGRPVLDTQVDRLGWAGLGWAGLGWAGLGWAGLGWAGLSWAGLMHLRACLPAHAQHPLGSADRTFRSAAGCGGTCGGTLHQAQGQAPQASQTAVGGGCEREPAVRAGWPARNQREIVEQQ